MIKIARINGRYLPVLICDTCGTPIRDGAMAVAITAMSGHRRIEVDLIDVIYAHKGLCHSRAEQRIRLEGEENDAIGWEELRVHLAYLVHNVGFTAEALERDSRAAAGLLD